MTALRVAIADDSMIVREGLARLLVEAGHTVVATAEDGEALVRVVVTNPDLDAVVVDIRMPPTQTDEGIAVARRLRTEYPRLGILVLSQHLESHYATTLLTEAPEHAGYLLKDRVSDVAVLVDALRRVVEGECVVDPTIVSRLMRARTAVGPLDRLNHTRAGGPGPDGRGTLERRDRGPARRRRPHPGGARPTDLPQARPAALPGRPPPGAGGAELPAVGRWLTAGQAQGVSPYSARREASAALSSRHERARGDSRPGTPPSDGKKPSDEPWEVPVWAIAVAGLMALCLAAVDRLHDPASVRPR